MPSGPEFKAGSEKAIFAGLPHTVPRRLPAGNHNRISNRGWGLLDIWLRPPPPPALLWNGSGLQLARGMVGWFGLSLLPMCVIRVERLGSRASEFCPPMSPSPWLLSLCRGIAGLAGIQAPTANAGRNESLAMLAFVIRRAKAKSGSPTQLALPTGSRHE